MVVTGFPGSCEQGGAEPGVIPPALLDDVTAFYIQRAAAEASRHRAQENSEPWCTTYNKLSVLPLAVGLWGTVECLYQVILTSCVHGHSLKYLKSPCCASFAIIPSRLPQQMPCSSAEAINADRE